MFATVSTDSTISATENRRIAIVASELLGRAGTGGAGTADSLLAVALARHGHPVELIVASGREIGELNPEWSRIYEAAGVKITILDRRRGVTPSFLAPSLEVFDALVSSAPDVAIVNDWRGLGWAALRAREAGMALRDTAFVVHCHGPGRVLVEFARKVPDTLDRFGEDVAERASIGLADAVVSPSEWLLEWMRDHRWPVPGSARVIQYPRRSAVLDEAPPQAARGPLRRLAFFGQLREGKGIRIFLDALQRLDPIDVVFLGSASKRWPPEELMRHAPAAHVLTDLTREEALAELRVPGTLAVMPSLLDNSPNTVSECIEHGIPFVATGTGGIAELVAQADRQRVLCAPTAEALAAALGEAIAADDFPPARAARDSSESLHAWLSLVATVQPARPRSRRPASRVAIVAVGERSLDRAQRLAAETTSVEVDVAHARSRRAGLARTAADWVVFLDEHDDPDDGLIDALVAAQAAGGADVVTAAVRPADDLDAVRLFLGDPGALGLAENHYGAIGLVRASLAGPELADDDGSDPDWLLFARLALAGARIAPLPVALSTLAGGVGKAGDVPGPGLAVLEAFEAPHVEPLQDLPQLAATLAAALQRDPSAPSASSAAQNGLLRRAARKVAR
jgi:glycosyltransferase involved in cell wall biosynthesis